MILLVAICVWLGLVALALGAGDRIAWIIQANQREACAKRRERRRREEQEWSNPKPKEGE